MLKEKKSRKSVRSKLNTLAKRNATRERLYLRNEKICIVCKLPKNAVENSILTIDHKIQVSKGGTGEDSNLQMLCIPCHKKKDNIPTQQRFPQFKRTFKRAYKQKYKELVKIRSIHNKKVYNE